MREILVAAHHTLKALVLGNGGGEDCTPEPYIIAHVELALTLVVVVGSRSLYRCKDVGENAVEALKVFAAGGEEAGQGRVVAKRLAYFILGECCVGVENHARAGAEWHTREFEQEYYQIKINRICEALVARTFSGDWGGFKFEIAASE